MESSSTRGITASKGRTAVARSAGGGITAPCPSQAVDATAVAHAYLSGFLGMTKEELEQLSAKYRSLPASRRGPDEITVADPELAAAAAMATQAAAAVAAAAVAEGHLTRGAGGTVCGVEPSRKRPAEAKAKAVKAAEEEAAGRLMIPEIPALASILHQQLGVPKSSVKRLLLKCPRLLEVSGYKLREIVHWLTETVGMSEEEVGKLVLEYPPILIKSVKLQLKPNLNWLEGELGLTRAEMRRTVCKVPQLLTKCVSANFVPKIEFFQEVLGLDRNLIGRLLVRYPQLFNASLENMTWKVRWLETELLLEPNHVTSVLARCPPIFAYSAERNLVPTLEFFLDELGATKGQVRQAVIEHPRLLGMSLENRLMPRLQEIRKAGLTPSWELHSEVMLYASDVVFKRWLMEEPTCPARGGRRAQGLTAPTKIVRR